MVVQEKCKAGLKKGNIPELNIITETVIPEPNNVLNQEKCLL